MTEQEIIVVLQKWQSAMRLSDNACSELMNFGLSPECEIMEDLLKSQIELCKTVSVAIGDKLNSLEWFWFDNDKGKGGLMGGVAEKIKPIVTISDLAWLIFIQEKVAKNET